MINSISQEFAFADESQNVFEFRRFSPLRTAALSVNLGVFAKLFYNACLDFPKFKRGCFRSVVELQYSNFMSRRNANTLFEQYGKRCFGAL